MQLGMTPCSRSRLSMSLSDTVCEMRTQFFTVERSLSDSDPSPSAILHHYSTFSRGWAKTPTFVLPAELYNHLSRTRLSCAPLLTTAVTPLPRWAAPPRCVRTPPSQTRNVRRNVG